jgi:hypothetical protein
MIEVNLDGSIVTADKNFVTLSANASEEHLIYAFGSLAFSA